MNASEQQVCGKVCAVPLSEMLEWSDFDASTNNKETSVKTPAVEEVSTKYFHSSVPTIIIDREYAAQAANSRDDMIIDLITKRSLFSKITEYMVKLVIATTTLALVISGFFAGVAAF